MKRIIMVGLLMVGVVGVSHAVRKKGGYGSGDYGYGSNPSAVYVDPTVTSDGTYREGHWRTKPNDTESDNYGTKGSYNPYKGTWGNRSWDDNN